MWCKTQAPFSFGIHPQPPLLHFAFIERLIRLQSFSNSARWEWCNYLPTQPESENDFPRIWKGEKGTKKSFSCQGLNIDLITRFSTWFLVFIKLQPPSYPLPVQVDSHPRIFFSLFLSRKTPETELFFSSFHPPTHRSALRYFSHCHMKNALRESQSSRISCRRQVRLTISR